MDMNTFAYTLCGMVNDKINKFHHTQNYNYMIYGPKYDINRRDIGLISVDNPSVKYSIMRLYNDYIEDPDTLETSASHIFALYYHRHIGMIRDIIPSKEDIFFMTASASMNEELMKECPHVQIYDDLVAFYRVKIINISETFHMPLTNEMKDKMLLDEQELFLAAKENTLKNMPLVFTEQEIKYDPDHAHFVYAEGQYSDTAANLFLFPELIKEIAKNEDSDLLIAPVGRNIIRLGATKWFDQKSFDRFLAEKNGRTDLNTYLSSQIYIYDKETGTIKCLTDNPKETIDSFNMKHSSLRR